MSGIAQGDRNAHRGEFSFAVGMNHSLPVSHQASVSWQLLPLTASGLSVAASLTRWAGTPAPGQAGQGDRFTSPEQRGLSSLDAHSECRTHVTLQGTLQSTILATRFHPFSGNRKLWLPIVCSMKDLKNQYPPPPTRSWRHFVLRVFQEGNP